VRPLILQPLCGITSQHCPQVHAFASHFDLRPDKSIASSLIFTTDIQQPTDPPGTPPSFGSLKLRCERPCLCPGRSAPLIAPQNNRTCSTKRLRFRVLIPLQTHIDDNGRTFFYDPEANVSSWDHPLDEYTAAAAAAAACSLALMLLLQVLQGAHAFGEESSPRGLQVVIFLFQNILFQLQRRPRTLSG
jgi:hypothetical protein